MGRVLRLAVKKEYFEQIKIGTKTEEYRIVKEFWRKRLENRTYDEVWITWGYPSENQKDRIIKFKYKGYTEKYIQHKEFGVNKVKVYAIKLEK